MEVVSAIFDPSNKLIGTGSRDHTANIYDVETGKLISQLVGHYGDIISINFSTDGKYLVTASFDNTARVFF